MIATPARPAGAGIPPRWPLTIEAYQALGQMGLIPRNTELLYGEVYLKMAKSPLHSRLLLRLLRILGAMALQGYTIRPEQPLRCADSEPEPDLSIVRGSEEDYASGHPNTAELVIEICISSHEYERSKLRAYAMAAVREVWLVLVPEQQVEVYRNPAGNTFASHGTVSGGEELTCVSIPAIQIPLRWLFAA